ncbi:glycosyltransferase [Frankia sp. B2]|uniref:glycosyltransferase n=1 Tax=Frankia TaxID=1854 RepID=UPI0003D056E0|nr:MULTISPECIES: glycosyltransferase [Frankia]ETA01928.1 glycosyl transferase, UDP-glucuronosyltransferase [Frankia sp. CcI6]KDA43370.1 glycosyl transferase, UDP-glucuronosyltransferase [Frankia sp. BMG5.23]OAA24619.1 glycosyltransferase, MGT family [Frankia casuarinae]OHV54609.1 glycosyl transferase [Frankia sp. CgIS1]ORT56150.1 glycosyl transferase [Frankia sp. KB5]
MSRVLFVVPPLTGHVNPAVGVAAELAARGHEVALAGYAGVIGSLIPPELALLALPEAGLGEKWSRIQDASRALRGPASLKFLWEDFLLPLGSMMAPAIDRIIDDFQPDLLVIDQQAVGAALVARRRGLRWATLAATSAEFDNPYGVLAGLGQWVVDRLREFQTGHGVPPDEAAIGDLRFSEVLTLVFSVREMLHNPGIPDYAVFVGSAVGKRAGAGEFPWDWLDPARRAVLVSLGTVTREAGGRFLRAAAEGLLGLPERVQAIVVATPGLVDDLAAAAPDDLLVAPFVPQVALLPRLSAVVCHAGNNTVCESLSHGVPLVVAPVRDDQPIIGEQVVRNGAGVRVKFGRAGPTAVRSAVTAVLDDPSYRAAAARMRAAFAAAGGVAAAADHLEKLAV